MVENIADLDNLLTDGRLLDERNTVQRGAAKDGITDIGDPDLEIDGDSERVSIPIIRLKVNPLRNSIVGAANELPLQLQPYVVGAFPVER
jgi:hypothetical protein